MNLIPVNGILEVIRGDISYLPSPTAWIPICAEDGEYFTMSQGDMQSAFYLFRMPPGWERFFCFNSALQENRWIKHQGISSGQFAGYSPWDGRPRLGSCSRYQAGAADERLATWPWSAARTRCSPLVYSNRCGVHGGQSLVASLSWQFYVGSIHHDGTAFDWKAAPRRGHASMLWCRHPHCRR